MWLSWLLKPVDTYGGGRLGGVAVGLLAPLVVVEEDLVQMVRDF